MEQRGVGLVEVIIILAIVAVGLTGITVAINSYLNGIEERGYNNGFKVAEADGIKKLEDKQKSFDDAIAAQKKEAAKQLAEALRDKAAKEQEWNNEKDQLERQYAKAQTRIEDQVRVNRGLIAAAGGLRDPGAREAGCGAGSNSAKSKAPVNAGSDNGRIGGARLSDEATDFLLGEAASCNKVVDRMKICRSWVKTLTQCNQ